MYVHTTLELPTIVNSTSAISGTSNKPIAVSGISIADPKMSETLASLEYLLSMRVCYGSLSFGSTKYYTQFIADDVCMSGHASRFLVKGTIVALNDALTALKYTPQPGWSGVDSIRVVLSNPGNQEESPVSSFAVTVAPSSGTQTIRFASGSTNIVLGVEDETVYPFTGLEVINEQATTVSLMITVPSGTLSVDSAFASEVTITSSSHSEGSSLVHQGTDGVDISDLLHAVTYVGSPNTSTASTGSIQASVRLVYGLLNDQYVDQAVDIALIPVDDPPTFTAGSFSGSSTTGVSLGALNVADVDSDTAA